MRKQFIPDKNDEIIALLLKGNCILPSGVLDNIRPEISWEEGESFDASCFY